MLEPKTVKLAPNTNKKRMLLGED